MFSAFLAKSAEEGRDETKYPNIGDGTFKKPNLANLRHRWKSVLAVSLITVLSFTVGTFANQVIVQQVQSLAGNHVLVPAPELQIVSASFVINGTVSLMTGVILNVTTVGTPGSQTGTKVYQVFVQVSCLDPTGKEFVCATGSNTITLPTNMAGTQAVLVVPTSPAIDPETTEVHDLSFIVTGSPTPIGGCTADFSLTASPTIVTLNETGGTPTSATVTKTITSLCNFSGQVTLTAKLPPVPGFAISFSQTTVTVPAGGAATVTEIITVSGSVPAGVYPITNVATSGSLSHAVTITANVINTPVCTPSFVITASPSSVTFQHGTNSTFTVSKAITATCGFQGTVTLTAISKPTGIIDTITPTTVTLLQGQVAVVTDTITNLATNPPGTYNVIVTATSGSISASVVITVQVV